MRSLRHVWISQSIALVLVSGACTFSPPARAQHATETSPTISKVVDGDTVIVRFPGGEEEVVRLLGIDTPESVDPNRPVQCFGAEATADVTALIPPGTPIRLERDVEARDHFGRLLAYIYRREDDVFVNHHLVLRGFADVAIYEPNTAYSDEFEAAATTARTQSRGLWSACGGPDMALDPP